MLEYYAPEIVLPSDVIVSSQIEHSTFRLGISSKVNKLLSQMEILLLFIRNFEHYSECSEHLFKSTFIYTGAFFKQILRSPIHQPGHQPGDLS